MAGSGRALTREDVLLHIPFDGDLKPSIAAVGTEAEVQGEFAYDEGKMGQCVRVGAAGSELRYPTRGNMNAGEGSFSVWIQSTDWTLADEPKVNRWWIDVAGPTRFIVYHYLHSAGVFFYHMDVRKERPSIIKSSVSWTAGEWKHLCATWKAGRLKYAMTKLKTGIIIISLCDIKLGKIILLPIKKICKNNLDA